jgi:uncharacterized membrane protein/nitrite reductase/ring-hydroxylating ferredoxin subunit
MRARASIQSHPIHPMLVAFPIGLWVTSFILDIIAISSGNSSYAAAGFYTIVGGCIGAALAAVPGAIDLFTVVPPQSSGKRRGLIHGGLNSLVLVLFTVIASRRGGPSTMPDGTSMVLSAIGVVLLGVSGWLGATLVYRNQIGVDHRYGNAGKWKQRNLENWERPACNEGELAYGQMMLVQVGSERVVIGRCAEGIVAFQDHCTHKGGALSDGALVGCTVQCPWHGSQFDVHTGRVVAGPAQTKITTYDVQVRAGEVYVMPKAVPEPRAA